MEYIIYKSENKRRPAERLTCQYCLNTHLFDKRRVPEKFICSKCKDIINKIEISCAHCNKTIKRLKSKIVSKFSFCSRKCKEAEQTYNGLIALPHYNGGTYREKALEFYGQKCKDCDITEKYLLVVHHIDKNRENNDLSNLEVLCHNHHATRHKRFVNGQWILDCSQIGVD